MRSVVRVYPGPPLSRTLYADVRRGCSSVGRAPALQAGGQRFDPVQLHHLFEGIEVNQLEVEFQYCHVGSRELILELVSGALQ